MNRRPRLALVLFLFTLLALASLPRPARADPWLDLGDSRLEDRFADGDLDAEDLAQRPAMSARRSVSASDLRSHSWLSLVGFAAEQPNGAHAWGAMAVVGIAFDRIVEGPVHASAVRPRSTFADDTARAPPPSPAPAPTSSSTPPSSPAPPSPPPPRPLAATLARGAVRAAWRASGIDADDASIDAMIARAHLSAALPEARLRVMRRVDDTQHTTTTAIDDTGSLYDGTGANLWLEARLTWRFDRLLYADDEPTIERVRLERQDARARVAARVLELLFSWQRAQVDAASSPMGSRAELDATLRRWESQIALDVLTASWFTRQPGVAGSPGAAALPGAASPSSTSGASPP